MNEPKERPILFSGEMVRAILDGRKTVTRRVIKMSKSSKDAKYFDPDLDNWPIDQGTGKPLPCPYGRPGDFLWVRETFMEHHGGYIAYKASVSEFLLALNAELGNKWTPSIFMPRWASRLTLRVTAVRVERVQDITAADAIKEGIEKANRPINKGTIEALGNDSSTGQAAIEDFRVLWDSINAKRGYSWESNPFVWCVSFELVD